MVAASAKVIFSGCSIEAIRVHTTAATMTAVGPLGQAVTNQKAVVIATASAERIPVRAAATGSGQSRPAGVAPTTLFPLFKAAPASRSRARPQATAWRSAARRIADTTSTFSQGVSLLLVIEAMGS